MPRAHGPAPFVLRMVWHRQRDNDPAHILLRKLIDAELAAWNHGPAALRSPSHIRNHTLAAAYLDRRTALIFPLFPPPQKNWSPPSDSSPDT